MLVYLLGGAEDVGKNEYNNAVRGSDRDRN